MPLQFDYNSLITRKHPSFLRDSADWMEWRYCFEGGRIFRDMYLRRYNDRETIPEFERRKDMTPIPAYAKKEINRIKNGLFQRFADILRRGGSTSYQSAMAGIGRGVDGKGLSMNEYTGKMILPELLVIGRVGVLLDAPKITGTTLADVPEDFTPYLCLYPVEHIPLTVPADDGQEGEFKSVMLMDRYFNSNIQNGVYEDNTQYRWYYLDPERGGKVTVQLLDKNGKEKMGGQTFTELTRIPLTFIDIGASLIQDACSYQRALLNLISSDTAYANDANFPFLTKQRKNLNAPDHLNGEGKSADVGPKKGLLYEHETDRPEFIHPSSEPLRISLDLRKEMKAEVRELITGALESIGAEGTVESGLAFIGLMLQAAENNIADDWAAYEQIEKTRRDVAMVSYPECWAIKSEKERIETTEALTQLMYKIPGRLVKKEIAKQAADKLLRGTVKAEKLDAIFAEIDSADYCTSDPDVIIDAKREGLVSAETGTMALGFPKEESAKAKEDQAERAATIVAAQADAAGAAAAGNPDGSVDPESAAVAKEGDNDPTAKLGGENDPGTRGENRPY